MVLLKIALKKNIHTCDRILNSEKNIIQIIKDTDFQTLGLRIIFSPIQIYMMDGRNDPASYAGKCHSDPWGIPKDPGMQGSIDWKWQIKKKKKKTNLFQLI